MGMFDSVLLDIKCPYCGETSEMECQTKQVHCVLMVWKKGDFVSRDFKSLECITDCHSNKCSGEYFYVDVILKRGKVTGKYNIHSNDIFNKQQ